MSDFPTWPWFTVVIPTRDSARWIGVLLARYQSHGITPTLLLDTRTRDATRAIAGYYHAPIVDISSFSSPEALVARTRDLVETPWALFLNDDEVPSDALFGRLRGPPPPHEAQSVAIARRWAWAAPGQPLRYGRSAHWLDRAGGAGDDHHWCLFQPARTKFIAVWHTDGFVVDTWCRLPPGEHVIHFEWVLRTRAQRAAKIARYDLQTKGFGSFFANMYLPEDQPDGVIEYHAFGTDNYDELAEAYFAAREPRLVSAWSHLAGMIRGLMKNPAPHGSRPAGSAVDRAGLTPAPENEIAYSPG